MVGCRLWRRVVAERWGGAGILDRWGSCTDVRVKKLVKAIYCRPTSEKPMHTLHIAGYASDALQAMPSPDALKLHQDVAVRRQDFEVDSPAKCNCKPILCSIIVKRNSVVLTL